MTQRSIALLPMMQCLLVVAIVAVAITRGFAGGEPPAAHASSTANLSHESATVKLADGCPPESMAHFQAKVTALAAQVDKEGEQTDLQRAVLAVRRLQTQRPTADSPLEARRVYYEAVGLAINVVATHGYKDQRGRYYEAQKLLIEELSAANVLPLADATGHRRHIEQVAIPLAAFRNLFFDFELTPHEHGDPAGLYFGTDDRLTGEQWLALRRNFSMIYLAVGQALRAKIDFKYDTNDKRNRPIIDNSDTVFLKPQDKLAWEARMRPIWAEEDRKHEYFTDQYTARQSLGDWANSASRFLRIYRFAPRKIGELKQLIDDYGLTHTPEGARILAEVNSE